MVYGAVLLLPLLLTTTTAAEAVMPVQHSPTHNTPADGREESHGASGLAKARQLQAPLERGVPGKLTNNRSIIDAVRAGD